MKQILWFRRDLRIHDSALLNHAKGEVLPIFIFDKDILNHLPNNDKRVTFIYKSVLNLKKNLKSIGLDLAIFYDSPRNVFKLFQNDFHEVLCSCDFDSYSISRDMEIEQLIPLKRFYDSFLIHPKDIYKNDGSPYKVFTPFYKNLEYLWKSTSIKEYSNKENLILHSFDYSNTPSLQSIGFEEIELPEYLNKTAYEILDYFKHQLTNYQENRDYFFKNSTSNLSVHLRFGLISPKQIFNYIKKNTNHEPFIRQLFWREFYNYILYHFPKSEFLNFNGKKVHWNHDKDKFNTWCDGQTGVAIIDAAMQNLNKTGQMHNRLRMIVASFLCKNLLLPWQWGEAYFALKLLDYEATSNIGSWQWAASTGADSVPYFRIFNPYLQSKKFDKNGIFIKSTINELALCDPRLFHIENGIQSNSASNYPSTIININESRLNAIQRFKNATN